MLKQEIKNGNFDIGEAIPIENIPFEKMNGFEEWHWNIVNQDEVSQGLIWDTDGTDRYMVDSSTTICRRTGYIPVIPNEIIYMSGYSVYAYDAEKNFVSKVNVSSAILIIPDDVYYIRLAAMRTDGVVPEFKAFRRGYGQTELVYNSDLKYSVYFPMFKDEIAKNGFATYLGIHPWADKKFCFIGDSFTAPGIWNRNMVDNLKGVYVGSEAVSGGAFSDYDGVPKTAYEQAQNFVAKGWNPDVILITLGTNDMSNQKTLGEIVSSTDISDFDLTTYTGGMQACLNYLQNNFPNAVIYIGWTPMGGLKKGGAEYIERMKEVALAYGVEYIETRTCGVTTLSAVYADCYENGINGGHPTANGQNKIAEYMTRLMSSKN
jgi:lysophospholipase L1-like esterase